MPDVSARIGEGSFSSCNTMNPSPQPSRPRRKRSPRRAEVPFVSVLDLPSPEELYLGVTAEYSTRAQVMEEQRLWLATVSKGAAAVKLPACPSVGRCFGPFPIPTNRPHQEVLLRIESAAMVAHRLAHLTSHPTPTIVEARMANRTAAEAISALHRMICQPSRTL